MSESKPTNPKDVVGIRKVGLSVLPFRVLWELALAMLEGAVKYGRHNYRGCGVRASVYFDALQRHIGAWWEGEDIDAESQLSHVTKAIASLVVLRDSMIAGNWVDDRPIGIPIDMKPLHARAGSIIDQHMDKMPHHYTRVTPAPIPEPLPPPEAVRVYGYPREKKVAIIKAIRSINGFGLKEAKDMSELNFPFDVMPCFGITTHDATKLLKDAGASL